MKQRWRAGEDEMVMRGEVRDVGTMLSLFRSGFQGGNRSYGASGSSDYLPGILPGLKNTGRAGTEG